jgi:dTDP-4-dehydrorhamnose 3,5-epimerase
MEILAGDIEGLFIIEPKVFGDSRGYFFESFHAERFAQATGYSVNFVQDNESFSQKGVLRGLHRQVAPYAQAKLVRVVQGSVLDVAVDVRPGSPTYGKHQSILLSSENRRQFFIPEGFLHGFLTLEDNTIFQYKCSNYYAPQHEAGIRWNDPDIGIDWGISDPILSERDKVLPFLREV